MILLLEHTVKGWNFDYGYLEAKDIKNNQLVLYRGKLYIAKDAKGEYVNIYSIGDNKFKYKARIGSVSLVKNREL